ncbi:uncharacterized protein ATNIH1004_000996 [Aspergillus tanneri]|uniref:Uncharacterized protein n=1 Tax=Aspergillus tanneri TaxID=1220188 RepID=A0A5M9MYA4_9EURO|nr:uncharacterized protein ATNIH1004_000996 [Aspergillus tanneri]KAA8652092.1 hypothetical protein ATNIH1004_000996 [Aspergillus tanneri]
MDEVNDHVFATLNEQHTIRVVGVLPTRFLRSEDYRASVSSLIEPFTTEWGKSQKIQLIAIDVYQEYTFFVLDINNWKYDYDTAHKELLLVPVYILRLSNGGNKWKFFRRAVDDRRIARRIADLHSCNDQNPLPFLEDHIKGPVYFSRRPA